VDSKAECDQYRGTQRPPFFVVTNFTTQRKWNSTDKTLE